MKPPSAPPLGRFPLLHPVIGLLLGILSAEHQAWPILVGLVVLSLYQGLWRNQRPLILGALFALLFALVHHTRLQRRAELANQIEQDREIQLQGTLIESNATGLVRRLFKTDKGAHILLQELPPSCQTGQKLILRVQPFPQPTPRNPTGWDPNKTLWKKGIAGQSKVISAQHAGWSHGFPALRGWSESIRKKLAHHITLGIANRDSADIVQAVVLGEKASGSQAFDNFRQTGTMHVFAVSGLHVGLVALMVLSLGWILRIPPRLLLWLAVLAMFAYAFITGLRPPALRAALMGSLIFGRYLLLRRPSRLNNLFAAALVVLAIDSFQIWQAGFQLSFLVVAVIMFVEPHLWKRIAPRLTHDPFLPSAVWTIPQHLSHYLRNKVGKMFTVSLAAWLGSAPLSFLYFGWITPIASLASVLMVFLAFLILALAFLSLILGALIPQAQPLLNQANGSIASFAKNSSYLMSQCPGAWQRIHPAPAWEGGLCVFDVGYGGAAIHLDAGGGLLIDGANEFNFFKQVRPALQAHGLSIDSLIATHNDAYHIKGLNSAATNYPIHQILLPKEKECYSLQPLAETCRQQQIQIHYPSRTTILPIDKDSFLEILYPGNPHAQRADDRGMVLLLHQRNWRILITSDAGYETEQALLTSGKNIQANVWICGRNTNDTMGGSAFIQAISPSIIIASDQNYPASEKVPPAWQNWLESEGIAFFSQRDHGAVFLIPQKDKIKVTGFLTNQTTILKRSHSTKSANSSPPPPTATGSLTSDQSYPPGTAPPPTSDTAPAPPPPTQSIPRDPS